MYDNNHFVASSKNFLKKYNNIYISENDVEVLKKYEIDVLKYKDVKSLIYDIEYILNTSFSDFDDLELVCEHLSETDYYNNTNK